MNEDIEVAIADALVKLGYKDVEHNCGTVWYTDGAGQTWSINALPCSVADRDAAYVGSESGTESRNMGSMR